MALTGVKLTIEFNDTWLIELESLQSQNGHRKGSQSLRCERVQNK